MLVIMHECKTCGRRFKAIADYKAHRASEALKLVVTDKFPPVEQEHCKFSNGEYFIQRDREFYNAYKEAVSQAVAASGDAGDYKAWSYGWYRCLSDSGSIFVGIGYRKDCICTHCYKEWGQPFYANKCCKENK